MTQNHEMKRGTVGRRLWAAALAVLAAGCLVLAGASVAGAAEGDRAPGTNELPLRAAEATSLASAPVEATAPVGRAEARPYGEAAGDSVATDSAKAEPAKDGQAKAVPAAPASKGTAAAAQPASFTISGMKYLEGRTLQAGEFTFRIAAAGAAKIPLASKLPSQLRSSTLSDAEKYELVAHGGLVYYPSALQPTPVSNMVVNSADGTVSFGPLTFDQASLGETSTQRSHGTVFCYTVAEQPPRNADGSLKDGVTHDVLGRYVYQGVTYDDTVKRIYLYVYETGIDSNNPEIAILPLGDATFDRRPEKAVSGTGAGFVNIFGGAVLDSYDGAVYLPDGQIAAGEFNFEVREVAEDGTILDDASVPCGAASDGSSGAGVRLITDEVYGEPGRFFYAVKQTAPSRAASDVVLDESSYVITVEVAKDADDNLEAAITHVRKKPADSDQWVDVDLNAQPSPVVWENRLRPATDPDEGGEGDGTGAEGGGAGTDESSGIEGGTDASGAAGTTSDDAQHAAGEAASDTGKPADNGATGRTDDKQATASGKAKADRAATTAKASSDFAQTGDDLGLPMLIAFAVVIASGIALVLLGRRRQK
ncbi:FctA domain-containing protein [Adlercreutzia sp. R21]|uniref:Spy0128 family protein n=1 Tax=Adlercreutzia wanghongyangiae TaxID=3111451 RepID=UPI002DC05397|nr:FctA domain-containing protein [Adlercreutzia sp. R21]MEC4183522.1 FctA domain-containing protein [Adlercreutzia sp. R21]